MLTSLTPQRAALLIFLAAFATISGAWIFEYYGFAPCELCLKQRWAYYLAIPLALLVTLLAPRSPSLARAGLAMLAIVWLGSMVFGIYHSGVEWKWWPGPVTCTAQAGFSGGLPDLSKPAVLCDTPAIRIFAVISLGLALLAMAGLRRPQGSSSVSQ